MSAASRAAARRAPTKLGYRPYRVRVAARQALSPHFVRLTFTGPDLDLFGTDRMDQRIKLLLPLPDGRLADVGLDDPEAIRDGAWYRRWRDLPESQRSPLRTYTVRDVDPAARALDVDFVVHGHAGPAGSFAARARPGDEAVVIGPDGRSDQSAVGIDFHPGAASHLLLVGDETAAPAIGSILECLPPSSAGRAWDVHAILEVPWPEDFLSWPLRPGVSVSWEARDPSSDGRGAAATPRAAHGVTLVRRLRAFGAEHPDVLRAGSAAAPQPLEDVDVDRDLLWEAPEQQSGGDFYAWLAGEAGAIRDARRFLVGECGVDRRRVAFMGYWRRGRAERN